jgi:hypothetical protein
MEDYVSNKVLLDPVVSIPLTRRSLVLSTRGRLVSRREGNIIKVV